MLYYFLVPLANEYGIFNIFRYITFRSGGAIITSLLICFIFGPKIIKWLKSKQKDGQPIREDGPESHLLTKQGTPTMGGVMIILSIAISTLLWADLSNRFVWVVLLVTLGFAILGFLDDYKKLTKNSCDGISGKVKLLFQVLLSVGATLWIMDISSSYSESVDSATHIVFPFFKDAMLNLGYFYVFFAAFVMVGSSNAVNLTDGLDGLAIVPVMIAVTCFGIISYLVGNAVFSQYLKINSVPGTGELAIICASVIGAGLGFLWFNAPPAQVFMGDTGSLSLGGMLGAISVITKHEIVLAIVGGIFVIETLSVLIQVYYFKMTGKRVFLMAPIHHHFEKKGWSESTVVIRFWIISVIFALIGLSTLKLR